MTIANWPLEDRPREKLIQHGETNLTDAELLAIVIKTGMRGKTALDIARSLLQTHGSLKTVLSLPPEVLSATPGMGPAKAVLLKAVREIGNRSQGEPIRPGTQLNNSTLTRAFVASRLRDHPNEVFACLFLDTHYRLIRMEKLFQGGINEASVYPREIVRRVLALNAATVILAHNHPSGSATPSAADKAVTVQIQQALGLIEVRVVDHIIVGNPDTFSFADAGLLLNELSSA